MDDTQNKVQLELEGENKYEAVTFRDVLVNAIKMQAMYSNGKIRYTETSSVRN